MDNTYLVFEYLDHDLAGLLDSKYEFTPLEVKCIMKQLFEVLKYLEDEHILHRDIKCGNILINNRHHVKLADFGLARSTIVNGREGDVDMTNNVVTMWYKAPELILGSVRYGHSVDVCSTACVMAELELGKPLMPGRTEVEQMDLICQVIGTPTEFSWAEATELPKYRECLNDTMQYKGNLKSKYSDKMSDNALSLLERTLVADPNKRSTASMALSSRYFNTAPLAPQPHELEPLRLQSGSSLHEYQQKQIKKHALQQQKEQGEQGNRALLVPAVVPFASFMHTSSLSNVQSHVGGIPAPPVSPKMTIPSLQSNAGTTTTTTTTSASSGMNVSTGYVNNSKYAAKTEECATGSSNLGYRPHTSQHQQHHHQQQQQYLPPSNRDDRGGYGDGYYDRTHNDRRGGGYDRNRDRGYDRDDRGGGAYGRERERERGGDRARYGSRDGRYGYDHRGGYGRGGGRHGQGTKRKSEETR